MERASPSLPARDTAVAAVTDALPAGPGSAESRTAFSRVALLALGLIVLGTVALHLWGITGDLPYAPDIDEPIFVRAAVGMLARHTLNPHWFGHPGSTVIYPIAALIELWYQAAKHLPPFAHPMLGVSRELVADPMPFYVIGRLVVAAYGVGCVVVTWLLGRRVLGDIGGLLAAVFLPTTAIVVQYGQIVRTDTAGMFFALLALWLTLRAMDLRRRRDWVLAAIAIGLAISSRYYFAILVVPYLAAAVLSMRTTRHESLPAGHSRGMSFEPFLALLIVPLTVAITSPYLLLDARQALINIRAENGAVHPGADGLSPIENLIWYIGTVGPSTFGLAILAVAVIGLVAVSRTHPRAAAVLVAYVCTYLIGVSASPFHWDRYIIPLVPIVGLLAAGGALVIGSAVARAAARLERPRRDRSFVPVIGERPSRPGLSAAATLAVIVLLVTPSTAGVLADARQRSGPSTRAVATDWVTQNLPPGSGIAQELATTYLPAAPGRVLRVFALSERSLDQYRADGYRYLISAAGIAGRFDDPDRYPREHAFYEALAATGRLVASFEPGPDRSGSAIRVYDIGSSGG